MPSYTRSYTFNRRYGGNASATIRAVSRSDGTTQTLAPADFGPSTGGALTAELTLPGGSHLLKIKDVGAPASAETTATYAINVGPRLVITGNSIFRTLWSGESGWRGSPFPTSSPATGSQVNPRRHSLPGGGWWNISQTIQATQNSPVGTNEARIGPTISNVGGNGLARLGLVLQTLTSATPGFEGAAIGDTTQADWLPGGSAWLSLMASLEAVDGIGNEFEAVFHALGHSETLDSVMTSPATFAAQVVAYRDAIRDYTEVATPFFYMPIGAINHGQVGDVQCDAIRQAGWGLIDNASALLAASDIDLPLMDASHHNAANNEHVAYRMAQNYAKAFGFASNGAAGPKPSGGSCTAGSNRVVVTFDHDGGTNIGDSSGNTSATGITGWDVTVGGAARNIVAAACVAGALQIDFDGDATIEGQQVVPRCGYGKTPSITKWLYDNTSPQGDTLPAPCQPRSVTVVAA